MHRPACEQLMREALQHRLDAVAAQVFAWEKIAHNAGELELCYPALAELWRRQTAHWRCATRAFLEHAQRFTTIAEVTPNLSDFHDGGRTVIRVRLQDGATWFYKHRGGGHERAWNALLEWVNGEGFPRPFRILQVVEAEDHCWMEGVEAAACGGAFFHRAGAMLYLAHVLRAVDLHQQNVIAAGEHPVLIDCETFLHPELEVPEDFRANEQRLARTGLIPPQNTTCSTSIAGFASELLCAHKSEVAAGFLEMHEFLAHRENAFRGVVAQQFPSTCRVVLRPTSFYHHVLTESLAPHLLADADQRRHYLTRAVSEPAEVDALWGADIPRLCGRRAEPRPLLNSEQLTLALSEIRALRE
jgi:lantibiotic modifying enzyme